MPAMADDDEPENRRQSEQWQKPEYLKLSLTTYRTSPQRHPPEICFIEAATKSGHGLIFTLYPEAAASDMASFHSFNPVPCASA
jgi:hypothetical protein